MDRSLGRLLGATLLAAGLATPAAAHTGTLRLSQEPTPVPFWLVVLTGGGVIGASFLFASLMTDHELIRAINARRVALPRLPDAREVAARIARVASVLVLLVVVASGLVGPRTATTNFAVLAVWAGWWAGYTMSVYLVGNTWPALNPWQALAARLPSRDREYPERLGAWPSVVGLVALVWLEVVSPVGGDPRLLSAVVLVYTAATLAGAWTYGADTWFRRVDPIARVFRCYGRLAPVQRTDDGLSITLPGAALARGDAVEGVDEAAFVIALLWVTTYDGLVSTGLWADVARALVRAGLPPLAVYLGAIVAGFGVFLGAYRLAAGLSRRTAGTYVSVRSIATRFAPSLLPIAAGYHLAHFLGYFLSFVPALAAAATSPFSPPPALQVLVVPGWFGGLQLLFILVGHVAAVWIAHSLSFDVFTGRLQPVRSQYPFVAVMILYTMTSMWIVARPPSPPPFV